MPVLMMQVRPMRMGMDLRLMPVGMGMGLARRIAREMLMLVMCVMHMAVRMLHRLVHVGMDMAFGEVKPCANGHQQSGKHQRDRERRTEDKRRGEGADEGCGAVIGPGPRRTEMAQGDDE